MLHIIATVCVLYSSPLKCKEITLSFAEEISPLQACMSPGPMIELSKWHQMNPNYWVKRYTCSSTPPDPEI